ncbi:response regulator transcription factor, partial [Klebsiella pneumoniae]|nr:response regulator transcription factor [Klebsiella pneumoniae]
IDRASAHFPDVVIMDIRMPGMDGITATAALVNAVRPPLVVALTSFDSEDAVFRALEAGAVGFLLKDTPPADLVGAIRTVMAGDAFL